MTFTTSQILSHWPAVLRFSAAGSKLLLLMTIASTGTTSLMGDYALLMIFVGLGSQFLGLEINAGVGRSVHTISVEQKIRLISSQLYFHLWTYFVLLIPITIIIITISKYSQRQAILIACVVFIEHFCVELYRVFVTLLKSKKASIFQFIRTVPFITALILFSVIAPEAIDLKLIAFAWLFNAGLAIIWMSHLINFKNIRKKFSSPFNIRPAVEALNNSKYLYLVSCIGALNAYADKFIVLDILGKESVGILYFFISVASTMVLIVSFTVGVKEGPAAIKQFETRDHRAYSNTYRVIRLKYRLFAIIISCPLVGLFYLFGELGLNKYSSYFDVFVVVVAYTAISMQADVERLEYYLKRGDKFLLLINTVAFIALIIMIYLFSIEYKLFGTASAMAAGSAIYVGLLVVVKKFIYPKSN